VRYSPQQLTERLQSIKEGSYAKKAQLLRSEVECARLMTAIRIACLFADKNSGGHFTLMRFTTGWAATFKTPSSRRDVDDAVSFVNPTDAVANAIERETGIGGDA